jgi:hypothetical protein
VRLFGGEDAIAAARIQVAEFFAAQEKRLAEVATVAVPRGGFRVLMGNRGATWKKLCAVHAPCQLKLDVKKSVVMLRGENSAAVKAALIELLGTAVAETCSDNSCNCAVCWEVVDTALLCGCKAICKACLQQQCEDACTDRTFPIKCVGCNAEVALADLRNAVGSNFDRLCKASMFRLMDTAGSPWRCCRTPDCIQVGRVSDAVLDCDQCMASWCLGCDGVAHRGVTCAELAREAALKATNENLFEEWKRASTRPCPRCQSAIEKNGGCNHVTCRNCQCHFCWRCAMRGGPQFTADSGGPVYEHMGHCEQRPD